MNPDFVHIDPSLKQLTGVIYRITNKISQKSYIGKSMRSFYSRYGRRWWEKTHNTELRADCLRLGNESFQIDILEQDLSCEELAHREEYWIGQLNTMHPNGYNHIANVARTIMSENMRAKLSESIKRAKKLKPDSRKGKTLSPEVIKRISEGHKGLRHTPESKAKISAFHKGRPSPIKGVAKSEEHRLRIKQGLIGRVFSSEHCRNISLSRMGGKNKNAKPILQLDRNTKVILKEHPSMADAGRELGLAPRDITRACCNPSLVYGGYLWQYKEQV